LVMITPIPRVNVPAGNRQGAVELFSSNHFWELRLKNHDIGA
jgi:hypothetical protein